MGHCWGKENYQGSAAPKANVLWRLDGSQNPGRRLCFVPYRDPVTPTHLLFLTQGRPLQCQCIARRDAEARPEEYPLETVGQIGEIQRG